MADHILPPGSRIGILGGGQLGRMIAFAAHRLGYRVAVLDPDPDAPAAQVVRDAVVAAYDDLDAVRALARRCDVVTCEFENVPAAAVAAAEAIAPCRPSSRVLAVAQHRVQEKEAVAGLGFPVPRWWPVRGEGDVDEALRRVGVPAVIKTARGGYDGRGQARARAADEAREAALRLLARSPEGLIWEEQLDLERELSVVVARAPDGRVACFPVAENRHVEGILDTTVVPARVPEAVARAAAEIAAGIAAGLDVVGLLAVEFFLARDGRLLVNELAPRPHNSGHYTLDACATSQFEQLVRAICGLPLGSTELLAPAAMANLLGELWEVAGGPDWAACLAEPGVRLHLYGKAQPRPRRKMGHLTALAPSPEEALARVLAARGRASRAAAGRPADVPAGGS